MHFSHFLSVFASGSHLASHSSLPIILHQHLSWNPSPSVSLATFEETKVFLTLMLSFCLRAITASHSVSHYHSVLAIWRLQFVHQLLCQTSERICRLGSKMTIVEVEAMFIDGSWVSIEEVSVNGWGVFVDRISVEEVKYIEVLTFVDGSWLRILWYSRIVSTIRFEMKDWHSNKSVFSYWWMSILSFGSPINLRDEDIWHFHIINHKNVWRNLRICVWWRQCDR